MNRRKTIITIVTIIAVVGGLDFLFTIKYPEQESFRIANLKLKDSTLVESGKIIVGSNVQGKIEAVVFPDTYLENGEEQKAEYIYMRFCEKWFDENLKPLLSKTDQKISESLIQKVKQIHEGNFRRCGHFNNIPIVSKEWVTILIKKKNSKKKKKLTYQLVQN